MLFEIETLHNDKSEIWFWTFEHTNSEISKRKQE